MINRPDALYQALVSDIAHYVTSPPVEVSTYGPPSYVKSFAAQHMLDNFVKKFIENSAVADSEALRVFAASNKTCGSWVSPYLRTDLQEADMQLVGQFVKAVDDFFNVFYGDDAECTWPNICENARSGPGSSIGARMPSFYAKHFSSPLTATSESLIRVYKAHAWFYPEFSNAELIRQEAFGSPRLVRGSRSSLVPKTLDVSRMICTEPSVNMYLQLGLGEIISKRLYRHFGIDLETQPVINRFLARQGSDEALSSYGANYCTIDLKSASDSISLGLLGMSVPSDWQSAILELRSPRSLVDGAEVELNMVSTMGNGFTFPLQTALFSCVVVACIEQDRALYSSSSERRRAWRACTALQPMGDFSVFGDDIIVDRSIYHRVLHLLELLGFTVNATKSFQSGGFRESCGHDYYHGYNVRPVFVRKLASDQDFSVLINLLNEWSTRTGIYVHNTIRLLVSWIKNPLLVPFDENMDSGIRVPFALVSPMRKHKWSVSQRRIKGGYAYKRYQARSQLVRIGDGIVHVPAGSRGLIYNPSGLLMAFLRGEIRNGSITVRRDGVLPYDTRRAVIPFWDYQRPTIEGRLFGTTFDKARWNTVTIAHLEYLTRGRVRKNRS